MYQGEYTVRYIQKEDERRRILHSCHVDPTAGHKGRERTLYPVREKILWMGMVKDVQEMVGNPIYSIQCTALTYGCLYISCRLQNVMCVST